MGTRLYCDHCGNTVRQFTKLAFGDLDSKIKAVNESHDAMQQQMLLRHQGVGGHSGLVTQGPYTSSPPVKPPIGIIKVELCDNCVPIWMKRVEMICKQSDVDETDV